MAKYLNYRYLYPPRPKNVVSPEDLNFWDNGTLIAQPKMNGSNCLIFTNGEKHIFMNRYNQRFTNFQLTNDEIKSIYRGNGEWMVINGEYLNKSKSDETNQVFNHKLIIFDILVLDGDYLVGRTFLDRIEILDNLYGIKDSEKDYLYSISENIYRVKTYKSSFSNLFNDLIKIDMIEGLVMKRGNAKLEVGSSESNNIRSQIKVRKPTKLYKY